MIEASGKSGRQVAREIGRSESFVSSTLAQGVCPRADTLARVADACGYKIVILPNDVACNLLDESNGIGVEYDGR
jgi:DNA-binding phage protein